MSYAIWSSTLIFIQLWKKWPDLAFLILKAIRNIQVTSFTILEFSSAWNKLSKNLFWRPCCSAGRSVWKLSADGKASHWNLTFLRLNRPFKKNSEKLIESQIILMKENSSVFQSIPFFVILLYTYFWCLIFLSVLV